MPETPFPMPGMRMDGSEYKEYEKEKEIEGKESEMVNNIKPHGDTAVKYTGGFNKDK